MKRQALVVGINRYPFLKDADGKTLNLTNPAADAEAIAQILRDYGRFEVKVLPEICAEGTYQVDEKGHVKAKTLQDAIYELFVEPADGKLPQTALLFFAGHSLAIDEYGETVGYLATSETKLEQQKGGIRLDWLAKQLEKSKVLEQIIWLDCCHSGKFLREIFEQTKPTNQDDVKRFIIAACRDSEVSVAVDGHGVLTHLLKKALNPEQYSVGFDINSSEVQAAVEREFHAHPKFKTYPQRPIFFSFGRPIHFWDGRETKSTLPSDFVSEKVEIDVDNLLPQSSVDPMHRDALVVGINRYPHLKNQNSESEHLNIPAKDAEDIANLLATFGNFMVRRLPRTFETKKYLIDPLGLVKSEDLKLEILRLLHPRSKRVPKTALLYFAGHGLRKEDGQTTEGYLAASDASLRKNIWGVSLRWLRQILKDSPVREIIIWLDCCHSGEFFNFFDEVLSVNDPNKEYFFITSSRDFEESYSSFDSEQGGFTELLLAGLDPTKHSDGVITNHILTRLVQRQSARLLQRPIIHCCTQEIFITSQNSNQLESLILRKHFNSQQ